ncbi:MAG: hypothetical protein Q4F29_12045 [Lachnospiraceae bacterium]|nr:hypothetical protein [Lachnospiraceae bacterium]
MKFRKLKKLAAICLAAVMTLGSSVLSYAGEWKQDEIGWWYQNDDGSYPVSTWYEDPADGSWYFFNEQGYMISNCYQPVDGTYYAFASDGRWNGVSFTDICPGVWNGANYSNEWSGFHINVPQGYTVKNASQAQAMDEGITFVEFVAEVPDGTGSGLELEYMDAYDYTDGAATTTEYIVSMQSLVMAVAGFTVEGITTVNLGGKEYMKLSADGYGLVKSDFYCRKVGDHYFECLTAIYWLASKPAMDGLLAGIY